MKKLLARLRAGVARLFGREPTYPPNYVVFEKNTSHTGDAGTTLASGSWKAQLPPKRLDSMFEPPVQKPRPTPAVPVVKAPTPATVVKPPKSAPPVRKEAPSSAASESRRPDDSNSFSFPSFSSSSDDSSSSSSSDYSGGGGSSGGGGASESW